MRIRLAVLAVAASMALLTACGSQKTYSDGSVSGTLTTGALPEVTIDGKTMRLAPGARIVNTGNLSITPDQVPANTRVRYKTDAAGQVSQVWILPAEE